jgi:outer membrane protein, heavy metal efflux system
LENRVLFRLILSFFIIIVPLFRLNAFPLTLKEVIKSVETRHPVLHSLKYGVEVKVNKELEAQGAFDAKFKSESKGYLDGYYDGNFLDNIVEKPLQYQGSTVYGGYRKSLGNFPDYYGYRDTEDRGEVRAGVEVPLFRNRITDERRGNIQIRKLDISVSEQKLREKEIDLKLEASIAYWRWLAAVQNFKVLKNLLKTAELRNQQIEAYVKAGDKPQFDLVDNTRAVLKRKLELVKAENEIQQSEIELSLYFRDELGDPIVVSADRAPKNLDPELTEYKNLNQQQALAEAYKNRPELVTLNLQLKQSRIDLGIADNQLLPSVNVMIEASKDIGNGARKQLDPAELLMGFKIEIPLQMRKQRGKLNSVKSQISEIERLVSYVKDKVKTEVDKAITKINISRAAIYLAERELEAARELEQGERIRLREGDSNLVFVNLREQTAAEAAISRINSIAEYQMAIAAYAAAIGKGFLIE